LWKSSHSCRSGLGFAARLVANRGDCPDDKRISDTNKSKMRIYLPVQTQKILRMNNPVVHFELPAQDRVRMADFYTRAFGWKTQLMDEQMGNYVLATTTEVDENGRPKSPGAINGGFFPVKPDYPQQHPSVVIGVADIREAMKSVAAHGGKVLGEPMEIPGVGLYVSFNDTEGNRLSLMQPFMKQ
jgi:predicted enzyme related to lactoylglutathione lyase